MANSTTFRLTRDQLAEFLPNSRAIKLFEQLSAVSGDNFDAITTLTTELDTHVNANIAHGTVGVIVGTTDVQTLTNKTLTTPAISAIVNGGTLTLPSATDTLVGRATTDTLLNKTLTAPVISSIINGGTLTLPAGPDTLVGRATTDTFTNKTYDTAGTGNVFRINGVAISTVSGTGSAVLATSPTITTPDIVGTATNDDAAAGSVGEYVTNTGLGVALTTGVETDVTSISLTAGDWDVQTTVSFNPSGAAPLTSQVGSTSSTSATLGGLDQTFFLSFAAPAGNGSAVATPVSRFSLASTTTIYAVARASFAAGTCTADALIRARRIR